MKMEPGSTGGLDLYHALISVVTPRPIAWVTSVDEAGRVNLAPFSYFNLFGSNPPVVVFSPTIRHDGTKKDTLLNVEATGEFVVHATVERLAESMVLSSKDLPRGESEVALTGLPTVPSDRVRPPRLADSPVALECRVLQILPIGHGAGAANLVVDEVVMIHIDDAILGPDGRVDPLRLRTIARMGGDNYCRSTDVFRMQRPD